MTTFLFSLTTAKCFLHISCKENIFIIPIREKFPKQIEALRIYPEIFVNMDNYMHDDTSTENSSDDNTMIDEKDNLQNNIGHENRIDNIQENSTEISARIKKDKKRKKKHHPDETVIKKLDLCYKRLIWYGVHSSRSSFNKSLSAACLLKRFLTK